MSKLTITEFLEARIAEDEATAQGALDDMSASTVAMSFFPPEKSFRYAKFKTAHTPARVLVECAAKRAILTARLSIDKNASDDDWSSGYSDANYDAVKALAAAYSDHTDYRNEWAK